MKIDSALIEELRGIDSPTLSNAVEMLEVRNKITGFADLHLRHLTPDLGVMCGVAVTAQAFTVSPEAYDRQKSVNLYLELGRLLDSLGAPGVVVIQELGPHPDFAVHCGDVMATLFRRFGGVGVVSGAGVRDVDEVRKLGVHLFARGTTASHANFHITAVQVPVVVCGLRVEPGDLLHGDADGLLVVPTEGRQRLPELARNVVQREDKIRSRIIQPGATLDDIREVF